MKKQSKVYDWYLWTVIIYSIASIFIRLKAIIFNQQIISYTFSYLIVAMFLFNFVMFIVFIVKNTEKISLILSGLYIFESGFSFLVGMILLVLIGAEQSGQSLIGPISAIIYLIIPLTLAIKLFIKDHTKSKPKKKIIRKKPSSKRKVSKKKKK